MVRVLTIVSHGSGTGQIEELNCDTVLAKTLAEPKGDSGAKMVKHLVKGIGPLKSTHPQ